MNQLLIGKPEWCWIMGTVRINKLKPGMVLADDVRDVKGRLLLTKGKAVGPEHLRIFKIWGITQTEIMGVQGDVDKSAEPAINPEWREAVGKDTEKLFCCADRAHPAVQEIFALAVGYRASRRPGQTFPQLVPEEPFTGTKAPQTDFLQKFLSNNVSLPEIPSLVFELNEVIANPLSTADQVAQVINKSPSLTAQLLKTVNSSIYGLPSKVDRVSLAVTLIGTRELSALALGISIMSIFKDIPRNILSMQSFLRHSLACAIVSRLLAAQKGMRQTEQMFTAGLLHDLGRLMVCIEFPGVALDAVRYAASHSICLHVAEKERMGCHHGQLGRYLLNQWRLPLMLENTVCFHHDPTDAPDPLSAAVVHVADILVNALGIGTSGERLVPPLNPIAWEALDLPVSCFEPLVSQTVHHLNTMEFLVQERWQ
jgi:HD-like signal output (HDOD) protein